jgi:hypothetical protein
MRVTILTEGLDLVEEDEQITHQIQLDEELDVQDSLSKFEDSFPPFVGWIMKI